MQSELFYRVLEAPEGLQYKVSGQKNPTKVRGLRLSLKLDNRSEPHFLHGLCRMNLIRPSSFKGCAIDCTSPCFAFSPFNAGRNQHAQVPYYSPGLLMLYFDDDAEQHPQNKVTQTKETNLSKQVGARQGHSRPAPMRLTAGAGRTPCPLRPAPPRILRARLPRLWTRQCE